MAELISLTPLAHRRNGTAHATFRANGMEMAEQTGLSAHWLTCRTPVDAAEMDVSGAARLGPCDWLVIDDAARAGAVAARLSTLSEGHTALVQDMSTALVIIDLNGAAVLDMLGVAPIARADEGSFTTRLADLRVTAFYRKGAAQWVRLVTDRSNADYLWEWLVDRIRRNTST